MATNSDIQRLTRKTESLQVLAIGKPPQLNDAAFSRFPEMAAEIRRYNEHIRLYDERIKNVIGEALSKLEV